MKNLHILPAKNPQVSAKGQIYLATHDIPDTHYPIRLVRSKPNSLTSHRKECVRQELYITSDEEIKEGDWVFDLDVKRIVKADSLKVATSKKSQCWYYKKIILTTDQDLIKDGVQAIDDEFLEWFVKNPSCDEVKVEDYGNLFNFRYLINPPKEEPTSCACGANTSCQCEEPKEKTFEEILSKMTLVNPKHLRMTSNGHGEFPDGYMLTEDGVKYIVKQLKNK